MMNNVKNKRLIWTVLFMWLCISLHRLRAASEKDRRRCPRDRFLAYPRCLYMAYNRVERQRRLQSPCRVLIKSEERGWDLFLSHHLHQNQIHNNYYIATDGEYAGKIVEKNSLRRRSPSY